jgi:iron complex transport system permease protein
LASSSCTFGAVRTVSLLVVVVAFAFLASVFVGRIDLDAVSRSSILELRATRGLVAFAVGASLSVAGVLVQGLFQNPLASPSVLGTTAGASLGGEIALLSAALLLGQAPSLVHPEMFLSLGCIVGATLSLFCLLLVQRRQRDLMVILLAGFALSSLFLSIGSFLTSIAQEWWELGRALVSFSLGDIGGVGKRQLWLITPLALVGVGFAYFWGHALDLLASGEDEARSLGLPHLELRNWTIVWASVLTAGAVSVGGNIGFVGLVVPHALRPFVGVTHRRLIPACVLGGGAFVLLCDLLARVASPRGEIPLGVVTGLVGAPVFLWLLVREQRWRRSA